MVRHFTIFIHNSSIFHLGKMAQKELKIGIKLGYDKLFSSITSIDPDSLEVVPLKGFLRWKAIHLGSDIFSFFGSWI